MAHRFTCTERVQFSDTDMAGIVHFSNFFRYMERVEHAFFRSLSFSIVDPPTQAEERVGWPRVHASCDYFAPLRFEEEFECELLVEEVRSKVDALVNTVNTVVFIADRPPGARAIERAIMPSPARAGRLPSRRAGAPGGRGASAAGAFSARAA